MTKKIWTAAELEQMTPSERHAIFQASIVADLDQAPQELLARARATVEKRIAEADRSQSS
ncbi:MAG: hypothetical protein GY745_22835 [Actinomycetia bacterium]|nr:hypothetical protein [Actinomycetes bacterium]MCP4087854.1 hypothetical protein [Actinomycetes bacterium]